MMCTRLTVVGVCEKKKHKGLDVDSIFSELTQESWLMFVKGDLIKVHSLNL